MANLKEVRDRIKSVRSTQQITKAMKMVAAAKLRKAQQAITRLRPYSEKLNEMLSNILSNLEGEAQSVYGMERDIERVLVVVVTSNRGLAGAFNSNLIKAAIRQINERYSEQRRAGNLSMMFVGKRGFDYFRKRYEDVTIIDDHVELFNDLTFDNVKQIPNALMQAFKEGTYDRVDVVYARFQNAVMQDFIADQFLPVQKIEATESTTRADYIFEPDQETLLEELVPSILQVQFQKYLLDTHASEHGARMTAMDKATENADELLKELKVNYNKARQEAITRELSEIVGGAAALESA